MFHISKRFSLLIVIGLLTAAMPSRAQLEQPVTPDWVLPQQATTARLSKWTADTGRAPVTLAVGSTTLRGYLYAGSDPKAPTLLFFNGSGQIIAPSDPLYRRLAQLGPSVAVYDYRGNGFSTGNPSVMDDRTDALKLYDDVAAQAPGHRVMVYGYSMGTQFATYVASQRVVAGLVLAAPFANAREHLTYEAQQLEMGQAAIMSLRITDETITSMDEVGMVKRSTAPLLVIHGTADTTIPFTEGHEVFTASPSTQKYFVQIKGAQHGGLPEQVGALQPLKQFIALIQKSVTP